MRLRHGLHLAYCTNIHPGQTWEETFGSLNRWTLKVKQKLEVEDSYAIGLRLSEPASRQLARPEDLLAFQRWLDQHQCYVFTINGFPYGRFHGAGVKEQVYLPDWADPLRLEYTLRLLDLLSILLPQGVEGSVSTLPVSFKEFNLSPQQVKLVRSHLWRCVEHLSRIRDKSGRKIFLALEPEPCCFLENSEETIRFFDQLQDERPRDGRLTEFLGVNYDACHFAVEFEEPQQAIGKLRQAGIPISKIHISNALRCQASPAAFQQLATLQDQVYLHQVIVRSAQGQLMRFKDLDLALASPWTENPEPASEWRVHFHVPLYLPPVGQLGTTADHVRALLKMLEQEPGLCSQLEMETYTWAVLPEALRNQEVTDQLVQEYQWTLRQLSEHGLT